MKKFNKITNIIFATVAIIFLIVLIYGLAIKGFNYTALIAIILDLLLAFFSIRDLKKGDA